MKKLFALIVIGALVAAGKPALDRKLEASWKASDTYARRAVVQLIGDEGGACTGVQVRAKSGQLYVLTAAHCRPLVNPTGEIGAVLEDKTKLRLQFVAEDDHSDLMLLTGDSRIYTVDVASKTEMYEKVHTMTHGGRAASYRTDGELLDEVQGGFMIDFVTTPEEAAKCEETPKYSVQKVNVIFFEAEACVLDVMSTRSTAQAIPGSSGGPMFNEAGELIGIVSYGNSSQPIFAFYVRLVDIQKFLAASAK